MDIKIRRPKESFLQTTQKVSKYLERLIVDIIRSAMDSSPFSFVLEQGDLLLDWSTTHNIRS